MNGKHLKDALKAKGLTQAALAEKFNVTPVAVSRWINETREPSDSIKMQLAELLDVSIDYLMGTSEDKKNTPAGSPGEGVKSNVHLIPLPTGWRVRVPLLSPEVTACCGAGIPVWDETQNPPERIFEYTIEELGGRYDEMRPPVGVRADGACLERSGIHDGDILVINPALGSRQWEPCVVCWHGALSAKKVVRQPDGSVRLYSDDEMFTVSPDELADPEQFSIWGPVVEVRSKPRVGM